MTETDTRPTVTFWTWKDYGISGISGNPDYEGEFVAQITRHGHVILTDSRSTSDGRGVWDRRVQHDDAKLCEGGESHAAYRENEAAGIFDRGWWVTDSTGRNEVAA